MAGASGFESKMGAVDSAVNRARVTRNGIHHGASLAEGIVVARLAIFEQRFEGADDSGRRLQAKKYRCDQNHDGLDETS